MYVRQEAVLSSQIEGTQSTLEDVLRFEVDEDGTENPQDVEEVVNYINAMNYGLERLEELPLSLRLIREIHEKLLSGVRGRNKQPGEFRTTQNWIGTPGAGLASADFIPPPPYEMHQALDNLEKFLHRQDSFPLLIKCGLAHAQFETIHPFADGNGRVGRLLITFLLCEREVLAKPLLYLSHYLKAHRAQYYDRLTAIRNDGDWHGWLKFFLTGVKEVSKEATETARAILNMREDFRLVLSDNANTSRLLDILFKQPIISVQIAQDYLDCSYGTASKAINELIKVGVLEEVTGNLRHRRFRFTPYLALFDSPNRFIDSDEDAQVTAFENE